MIAVSEPPRAAYEFVVTTEPQGRDGMRWMRLVHEVKDAFHRAASGEALPWDEPFVYRRMPPRSTTRIAVRIRQVRKGSPRRILAEELGD